MIIIIIHRAPNQRFTLHKQQVKKKPKTNPWKLKNHSETHLLYAICVQRSTLVNSIHTLYTQYRQATMSTRWKIELKTRYHFESLHFITKRFYLNFEQYKTQAEEKRQATGINRKISTRKKKNRYGNGATVPSVHMNSLLFS